MLKQQHSGDCRPLARQINKDLINSLLREVTDRQTYVVQYIMRPAAYREGRVVTDDMTT